MQKHGQKRTRIAQDVGALFTVTGTDGKKGMVGRQHLKGNWTPCHGMALDGTAVESLSIQVRDDKAFVLKPGGRIEAFDANEFERAAITYAQMRGYKIHGPDGQPVQF